MLPERQPSTCRKGSTERRRLHECLCVVFRCLLWRPVLQLARLAVELHVYVLGLSKLWCRPSIREWGWSTESYYYMRPTPNHGHLHPEQNSHCREGIVPLLCALYFWNTVLFSRRAHQWFQGGRQWTQQTCCFQIDRGRQFWANSGSYFAHRKNKVSGNIKEMWISLLCSNWLFAIHAGLFQKPTNWKLKSCFSHNVSFLK